MTDLEEFERKLKIATERMKKYEAVYRALAHLEMAAPTRYFPSYNNGD